MLLDQIQRFSNIAIIGNQYGTVECIQPGIIEQMNSQVDIGTFLFSLIDFGKKLPVDGGYQTCAFRVGLKTSVIDTQFGNVMLESSKVCFLADRLMWVGSSRYQSCEILDGDDLVIWFEKVLAKQLDIKPLVT